MRQHEVASWFDHLLSSSNKLQLGTIFEIVGGLADLHCNQHWYRAGVLLSRACIYRYMCVVSIVYIAMLACRLCLRVACCQTGWRQKGCHSSVVSDITVTCRDTYIDRHRRYNSSNKISFASRLVSSRLFISTSNP
jgi:hypothetical protein